MKRIIVYFFLFIGSISFAKLKVGVTMLPYYSYVANIVGDKMEVVPLVPENINTHNYDATPKDVKKLAGVDIVVINGIGNDEYVYPMLRAAQKTKPNIKIINANKTANLQYISGQKNTKVTNVHTYISITQSIKQIDYIAQKLGELDPKNATYYKKNAREYDSKLRKIKQEALAKVKGKMNDIKIATSHAGYDYLLAEFGLTVLAVVEPSYTQSPTASDLKLAIEKIKSNKIDILFDEELSNHKNAKTIQKDTGVYIATLNHMTQGAYYKGAFEKFIKLNMNSVTDAILTVSAKKK